MSEINPEIDKKENTVTTNLNHMSGDDIVTTPKFGPDNKTDAERLAEMGLGTKPNFNKVTEALHIGPKKAEAPPNK